jgi:hypothetical protein
MKLITLLISCTLLLSCNQNEIIKISLIDNNCVEEVILDIPPFDYPYAVKTDSLVAFTVLDGENSHNKTIRFKNISNTPITFFDISKASPWILPKPNNQGSLWINETEENNNFKDCISENKYSLNITKFEDSHFVTIILYEHNALAPYDCIDFDIEFKYEGNYKVTVLYTDSSDKGIGAWGLNKTQHVISDEFKINLTLD